MLAFPLRVTALTRLVVLAILRFTLRLRQEAFSDETGDFRAHKSTQARNSYHEGKVMRNSWMRFVLVPVISIAATWLLGSVPSRAATVDISFSGTVQQIIDPYGFTGYTDLGPISGTLTIGPIGDAPTSSSPEKSTYLAGAHFKSGVITSAGAAYIDTQNVGNAHLGHFGIFFHALPLPNSVFSIGFDVFGSSAVPLQSLGDLPTDLAGITGYLGGVPLSSEAYITGEPQPGHQYSLSFALNSISLSVSPTIATPLPTPLPLLLTAIVGLWLVGRRRGSFCTHGAVQTPA
jgi:hypothetical protein